MSEAGQTAPGLEANVRPMAWDPAMLRGTTAALTDQAYERDLRALARVVSTCTLGLWAFAAGLLIGVFFVFP